MYTKQTAYLIKFEDDTYARVDYHDELGLCIDSVDLNEASQFTSLEDESDSVRGVYSLIKEMEHSPIYNKFEKIDLKVKEIEKVEVRTIIDHIETISIEGKI